MWSDTPWRPIKTTMILIESISCPGILERQIGTRNSNAVSAGNPKLKRVTVMDSKSKFCELQLYTYLWYT